MPDYSNIPFGAFKSYMQGEEELNTQPVPGTPPEPVGPPALNPVAMARGTAIANKKTTKPKLGASAGKAKGDSASVGTKDSPTTSWEEAAKALQGLESEGRAHQKDLVDKLRRELDQAKDAPENLDLSALMSLADAWTGSNMAGGYRDPNRGRERRIAGLESRLNSAVQGLSDSEMSLMRSKLNNALGMAQVEGAEKRAKLAAAAKEKSAGGKDYTDIEYAKKLPLVPDQLGNLNRTISKVSSIKTDLQNHPELSRFVGDSRALEVIDKDTVALMDRIKELTMKTLKETLGPQFTAAEAEQLIKLDFNAKLSLADNLAKLDRKAKELEGQYNIKKGMYDHWKDSETSSGRGTLRGYRWKEPKKVKAKTDKAYSRESLESMSIEELKAIHGG